MFIVTFSADIHKLNLMTNRRKRITAYLLILHLADCTLHPARAENSNENSDFGSDYAFVVLMTLTPEFATANYTIENDAGNDIDISIARVPYHFDLSQSDYDNLTFEISAAYQRTREIIPIPLFDGEFVDSEWDSYGGEIGLLYSYNLTNQLHFTPSLRFGMAKLDNNATYNGNLANALINELDGSLFNWKTSAAILNLGLGLSYDWTLHNRQSSLKANIYRVRVNSFNESNPTIRFDEYANMLSLTADMIFPSSHYIASNRLDYVLILGNTTFLGENRRTLGYTSSNQFGIGGEAPIQWGKNNHGHIRLSGQVLWAHNMNGWLITLAYHSN